MKEMYDRCCVETEDCCVDDLDALTNMDELHRRYNCCAFDGPDYFTKLNKVNFPQSCCPEHGEISFRCSAENAYKAACKTKINAELNPYVIILEAYCFATAFFCGVVTTLIVVMATLNIYMNKSD
uniref:23 kDa integral membrane protein n=1 Tax=Lygus hesperus TaxID=30085 RepID=A0A0A9YJM8_LYGHE